MCIDTILTNLMIKSEKRQSGRELTRVSKLLTTFIQISIFSKELRVTCDSH